jgi:hypothetical protein
MVGQGQPALAPASLALGGAAPAQHCA